jgi:SET domain-containing protein
MHARAHTIQHSKFPQPWPCKSTASARPPAGRRIQVRRSGVHGKGVFALVDMAAGARASSSTSASVISWDEAQRRHPHDPGDPNHTFYFHARRGGGVIDAPARRQRLALDQPLLQPNCKADEQDGRIFITALRAIRAGEELNYDYGLVIDEPPDARAQGRLPLPLRQPANCRGTLLSSDLDTAESDAGKPRR